MERKGNELYLLRHKLGLADKVYCTKEECAQYDVIWNSSMIKNNGIYREILADGTGTYYRLVDCKELTLEEKMEYISLMQAKYIKTIKNCILFFTILFILSMIIITISILLAFS